MTAEFPDRIKALFDESKESCGKYVVNFIKNGERVQVEIDDYFPCSPVDKSPIFSTPHGNELWVLILEKAWAKLHGTYKRCALGSASEAFRDVLGAPSHFVNVKDTPDMFE